MLELFHHFLFALGAVTALTFLCISRGIAYTGGVPRVGPSGVIGYIITALQYTLNAESIIVQGRAEFSGRPFVIPTLVKILS